MRFLLIQYYGRVHGDVPPMTEWSQEDVEIHIRFHLDLTAELTESGELVQAHGLAGPDQAKVVLATGGSPRVSEAPFPVGRELIAGWRMVEVDTEERALEIAAISSASPGPNGVPLRQEIEVRRVMGSSAALHG